MPGIRSARAVVTGRLVSVGLGFVVLIVGSRQTYAVQGDKANCEFEIRQDPRLQHTLFIAGDELKLVKVLKRLEKATMLKFMLDPKLGHAELDFGASNLNDYHAWMVMNLILYRAKMQWQEPRWVAIDGGFMLTAEGLKAPPLDGHGNDR